MGRKRDAHALLEADNAIRAVDLRKKGWTYEDIAAELSITPRHAKQLIQGALDKLELETSDKATELREIILQRIEDAVEAIYERVEGGQLDAIDRLIKLNDQAAMILGAKVSRHDFTTKGEAMTASAEQLATIAQQAREELEDWESDADED